MKSSKQKDVTDSIENDATNKTDEITSNSEAETTLKSETESVLTEVENTRKLSDGVLSEKGDDIRSEKDDVKENSDTVLPQKIGLGTKFGETNFDDLRKHCNETPTYEAWKTGQVPSPLKRGTSCKTPSPPPCPEKITKSASVPTSAREKRNGQGISNGMKIINILKSTKKLKLFQRLTLYPLNLTQHLIIVNSNRNSTSDG